VEENNFNHALHHRSSRLLFTGPYLLVETSEAMDVPEEITAENVMDMLEFSEEWEDKLVEQLQQSPRFAPLPEPSHSSLPTLTQPGLQASSEAEPLAYSFSPSDYESIRQAYRECDTHMERHAPLAPTSEKLVSITALNILLQQMFQEFPNAWATQSSNGIITAAAISADKLSNIKRYAEQCHQFLSRTHSHIELSRMASSLADMLLCLDKGTPLYKYE
jgi:hypothetical protein